MSVRIYRQGSWYPGSAGAAHILTQQRVVLTHTAKAFSKLGAEYIHSTQGGALRHRANGYDCMIYLGVVVDSKYFVFSF